MSRIVFIALLVCSTSAWPLGRVIFNDFENSGFAAGTCSSVTTAEDGVLGPYAGGRMMRCAQVGVNNVRGPDDGWNLGLPSGEKLIRIRSRLDRNVVHANIHKIIKFTGQGTTDYIIINAENGCSDPVPTDHNGDGVHRFHVEAISPAQQLVTTYGSPAHRFTHDKWHEVAIYIREGGSGRLKTWFDGVLVNDQAWNTGSSTYQALHIPSNWSVNGVCSRHNGNNYTYWDNFEVYTPSGTGGTGSLIDNTAAQPGGGTGGPVNPTPTPGPGVPTSTPTPTVVVTPPAVVSKPPPNPGTLTNNGNIFSWGLADTTPNIIDIAFNQTLSTNVPAPGQFNVTSGATSYTVTQVAVQGPTLSLTLSPTPAAGTVLNISYTDPTASDDTNAVQSAAGLDSPNFATTLRTVAGYELRYGTAPNTYTQTLDAGNGLSSAVPGTPGTTIYVVVRAYDQGKANYSANSNEVSYSVPAPNAPVVVQSAIGKSWTTTTTITLPNPVRTGNKLLILPVAWQSPGPAQPTFSDNAGTVFVENKTHWVQATQRFAGAYSGPINSTGTRVITATWNAVTSNSVAVYEIANADSLVVDGDPLVFTGSGSAVSMPSVTTTADSLIFASATWGGAPGVTWGNGCVQGVTELNDSLQQPISTGYKSVLAGSHTCSLTLSSTQTNSGLILAVKGAGGPAPTATPTLTPPPPVASGTYPSEVYKQEAHAGALTLPVTINQTPIEGNLMLVAISGFNSGSVPVPTITDNRGNTWQQLGVNADGPSKTIAAIYGARATNVTAPLTITYNAGRGTASGLGFAYHEFANVHSDILDGAPKTAITPNTTAHDPGSLTATANDLYFMAGTIQGDNTVNAAGGCAVGINNPLQSQSQLLITMSKQAPPGSVNCAMTSSAIDQGHTVAILLKGSPPAVQPTATPTPSPTPAPTIPPVTGTNQPVLVNTFSGSSATDTATALVTAAQVGDVIVVLGANGPIGDEGPASLSITDNRNSEYTPQGSGQGAISSTLWSTKVRTAGNVTVSVKSTGGDVGNTTLAIAYLLRNVDGNIKDGRFFFVEDVERTKHSGTALDTRSPGALTFGVGITQDLLQSFAPTSGWTLSATATGARLKAFTITKAGGPSRYIPEFNSTTPSAMCILSFAIGGQQPPTPTLPPANLKPIGECP